MEEKRTTRLRSALFYGLALAVLLLQISGQSFWTDEAIRMYPVAFEGLDSCIQYGLEDKQLLFVLVAYLWRRIFGAGEWALRALNLPFALVMLWYVRRMLQRSGRSPWYALLLLIQPVFAYYMDEASPYLMLGASGAAFFYYAFYAPQPDSAGCLVKLNGAFLVGIATHFVFVFVYPAYLLSLAWRVRQKKAPHTVWKRHAFWCACFSPLYLLLAFSVLQNLSSGADRGWGLPGLKNLAAILYLFLGLGGLCLSRNELRAADWAALDTVSLTRALLLLFAMALLLVVLWQKKRLWTVIRAHGPLLAGCGLYAACFWVAAMFWHFQLWERHLFPLLIPLVLLEAEALSALKLDQAHRVVQGAAILLVFLLLVSCFNLRFTDRYAKDDYKGVAASLHEAAQRQEVALFTSGYHLVYRFYGVAPQDASGIAPGPADLPSTVINGWSVEQLEQALRDTDGPAAVVLNEKELPADTYHWKGPQGCTVDEGHSSFRILWVP